MPKKPPPPFNNPFGTMKLESEKPKPAAAPPAKAPPQRAAPPVQTSSPKSKKQQADLDEESRLFLDAVGEVNTVRRGPPVAAAAAPPSRPSVPDEEAESLTRLAELISGEGSFEITDSGELVEGRVQGFDAGVMKKLRAGDFAIRVRLDLHGMVKADAKTALESFISRSKLDGQRCVLVVTGRGLHSADQVPVIKEGVLDWLTRGRLARHVLAFCTARPQDGGAGALYVLLRR